MSEAQTANPESTPLEAWKASKLHKGITLPSGVIVDIILPNLPHMLQSGDVPNPLVQAALGTAQGAPINEDTIREQFDFYKFLVAKTVQSPPLSEDDVADLPFEDIEMLVEIASRNRDFDAVGHHLGGLEKHADFRRFRGLDSSDTFGASL